MLRLSVSSTKETSMISSVIGQSGFPLFGPYIDLPAGSYIARFCLDADGMSPITCGHVDVCRDFGETILTQAGFSPLSLKTNSGIIELGFEVDTPGSYEFRVASNGRSEFRIGERSLKAENDYFGVTGSRNNPVVFDEFFFQTSSQFLHMVKYGGRLSNFESKLVLTMNGIRMHLKNVEDFQIIDEVHILNTYNFKLHKRCCVIDIGMNVGFSTLYFARRDAVEQVHSFEPFGAPYLRAMENIALNPEISDKITTHNFGLSAETATNTVMYDDSTTIGASIRGNGGARGTTISLQTASGVLTDIIYSAKAAGQAVVVKMDCEGSEFAILDDLASSGLLPQINIIMIEWHKWWSPDKTDETLIDHLLQSGFSVFNTTQLHDPFAGMIYAAKTAS